MTVRKTANGYPTAAPFLPADHDLASLREAAKGCEGCPLFARATQTVFGEGRAHAPMMLIGEQPGDREDVEGKPFVGPAGMLLDRCLQEAGIDRKQVYVTNAVKHFKWEPRGKRRIHEKPNSMEIAACRPWLDAEMEAVKPRLVVCLGATAAQALLGRSFRVTKSRGEVLQMIGLPPILATVHPSSILRAIDDLAREQETAAFIEDMRRAAKAIAA